MDDSGEYAVFDRRNALQRFEFGGSHRNTLYRFNKDDWVYEWFDSVNGKTQYRKWKTDQAVIEILRNKAQPPNDLSPTLVYPLPWYAVYSRAEVELMRKNERGMAVMSHMAKLEGRNAKLIRLQNGLWLLVSDHLGPAQILMDGDWFVAPPSQTMSNEEALDLLFREGYPRDEYLLPDDLVELAKHRRLRASQPTVAASTTSAVSAPLPSASDNDDHQPNEPPKRLEELLPGRFSARELADLLTMPIDQVDSALRRYRANHPDCYDEMPNPRRNEPKYLYRKADVLPIIQRLLKRR